MKTGPDELQDDPEAPIEVYADDSVIDGGIAAIPKMLLRFARHLDCAGTQLNDRQVLLLIMVIALREDRTLRLSNLPMTAAVSTLETDLAFLRKAGLILTQRDYYPPIGGQPPRMRSQIWDIRSLNANLAHIQKLWFRRQAQKKAEWRATGERGPNPVYEFPRAFRHMVAVPRTVLEDIAAGRFFPVPERWLTLVKQTFSPNEIAAFKARLTDTPPTPSITADRGVPTARNTAGRDAANVPTASNTGGHLVKTLLLPETTQPLSEESVFAHFAARLNAPYQSTGNDRKALKALESAGYLLPQMIATIDEVFDRGDTPQRFAYCAQIVRDRPPACPPVPLSDSKSAILANDTVVLPPDLERFVVVLLGVSAGDEVGLRRRLRVMAESCEEAARQHNATGVTWLRDALDRSIGKEDPFTYAAAILRSWATHGPDVDLRPKRERQSSVKSATRAQALPPTQVNWNDSIDA